MLEFYGVLNIAWMTEIKGAARLAINASDMPRAESSTKTQ
jgi:hypothetical protein